MKILGITLVLLNSLLAMYFYQSDHPYMMTCGLFAAMIGLIGVASDEFKENTQSKQ